MKKTAGGHNRPNKGKSNVSKSRTRVAQGKKGSAKNSRRAAEQVKEEDSVRPIANGLMPQDLKRSAEEQEEKFLAVGHPTHSRKAS
jgi:hypothetical protein